MNDHRSELFIIGYDFKGYMIKNEKMRILFKKGEEFFPLP